VLRPHRAVRARAALVFLVSVGAIWILMSRTRAGGTLCDRDNEQTARLRGVDVGLHKTSAYVLCAGMAAWPASSIARSRAGQPNDGVGYELDAIAAVVIGGTRSPAASARRRHPGGTLIIGIINNSMG